MIALPGEIIGETLQDLGVGEEFLGQQNMTHKRKKLINWILSKLKTFVP